MTKEESPQINNLTAWMSGFSLSTIQKADAICEFYELLAYVDKLESQLQQNKVEERECECCNKKSDAGSQIFICEDCSNKPIIEITN